MKGIILAGGSGTRLHPATLAVNKQLLPVYDKPMIYYPLSILMLADLQDILIISSPDYIDSFRRLLGDGAAIGMRISYAVQERPEGLTQAFHIGEDFLAGGPAGLILGDNIFYGANLQGLLAAARHRAVYSDEATVFGYHVDNPAAYGVVELDDNGKAIGIEEKPFDPRSSWALTGLYFYDSRVCDFARHVRPSSRGELEITDLNRLYMEAGALHVECLGRGYAWLDTGTHDNLIEASSFVRTVQQRQGLQIACLEEIAWQKGWIDSDTLSVRADFFSKTSYGAHLARLLLDRT